MNELENENEKIINDHLNMKKKKKHIFSTTQQKIYKGLSYLKDFEHVVVKHPFELP
jgi:hypothetical protein